MYCMHIIACSSHLDRKRLSDRNVKQPDADWFVFACILRDDSAIDWKYFKWWYSQWKFMHKTNNFYRWCDLYLSKQSWIYSADILNVLLSATNLSIFQRFEVSTTVEVGKCSDFLKSKHSLYQPYPYKHDFVVKWLKKEL